jgi:hypothetical protein
VHLSVPNKLSDALFLNRSVESPLQNGRKEQRTTRGCNPRDVASAALAILCLGSWLVGIETGGITEIYTWPGGSLQISSMGHLMYCNVSDALN